MICLWKNTAMDVLLLGTRASCVVGVLLLFVLKKETILRCQVSLVPLPQLGRSVVRPRLVFETDPQQTAWVSSVGSVCLVLVRPLQMLVVLEARRLVLHFCRVMT